MLAILFYTNVKVKSVYPGKYYFTFDTSKQLPKYSNQYNTEKWNVFFNRYHKLFHRGLNFALFL